MKVSERTRRQLESLKDKLGVERLDDVIQHLLRERRGRILTSVFGRDKGRISPFTEHDRG